MSARGLSDNLKIGMMLLTSGVPELALSTWTAVQTAETYRDKIAATHPLQLALAEIADRLAGGAKPREFDESVDYAAEAERKFGDGKILAWLKAMLDLVSSLQGA